MEDMVLWIGAGVLLIGQLLLCLLARKTWLKWIPVMVIVTLQALCFLAYGLSGWTNWGFLILFVLLVILLGIDATVFVFGFLMRRLLQKNN